MTSSDSAGSSTGSGRRGSDGDGRGQIHRFFSASPAASMMGLVSRPLPHPSPEKLAIWGRMDGCHVGGVRSRPGFTLVSVHFLSDRQAGRQADLPADGGPAVAFRTFTATSNRFEGNIHVSWSLSVPECLIILISPVKVQFKRFQQSFNRKRSSKNSLFLFSRKKPKSLEERTSGFNQQRRQLSKAKGRSCRTRPPTSRSGRLNLLF